MLINSYVKTPKLEEKKKREEKLKIKAAQSYSFSLQPSFELLVTQRTLVHRTGFLQSFWRNIVSY